jgi:hypothetical protein
MHSNFLASYEAAHTTERLPRHATTTGLPHSCGRRVANGRVECVHVDVHDFAVACLDYFRHGADFGDNFGTSGRSGGLETATSRVSMSAAQVLEMPVEIFRERRWSSKDGARLTSTTEAITFRYHIVPVAQQVGIAYIPKPLVPESENIKEIAEQAKYAEEMRAEIPADRDADPERWRVHELLSWFLEFHRRESKPISWARYERQAMTEQELVDDMSRQTRQDKREQYQKAHPPHETMASV